jgi:large subunit ribosomal protein L25
MTTLIAHKREKTGTRNNTVLRTLGNIPGVLYGPKEPAQPIVVEKIAFEKAWKTAGESTVVILSLEGTEKEVLIHDVSMDPVRGVPTHVDLYAIEKGKKVEVHVPLEFVGESPAEKQLGGTLVKVLHEVLIEALPKDLPHELTVDISVITELDTPLHIKDLKLPVGVTCLLDAEEVVATVSEVKEVVDEEPTAIDMSAIEVSEERGKKEEPADE